MGYVREVSSSSSSNVIVFSRKQTPYAMMRIVPTLIATPAPPSPQPFGHAHTDVSTKCCQRSKRSELAVNDVSTKFCKDSKRSKIKARNFVTGSNAPNYLCSNINWKCSQDQSKLAVTPAQNTVRGSVSVRNDAGFNRILFKIPWEYNTK